MASKSATKTATPIGPVVEDHHDERASDAGPASPHAGLPKKKSPSAEIAEQIIAGTAEPALPHYARALESDNASAAHQAARVIDEVILRKPELVAPHIERLVRLLTGHDARVVHTSATALPVLARVAPAKVARHLERLREGYDGAIDGAKDGMVRTFVALCIASVAYQKRVIDVLERALDSADPKTLQRWTELVLPALKGEPHAQARTVVEQRLPDLPRPQAEKIAEFLGVRLRRY
jgi:hypothetical protein